MKSFFSKFVLLFGALLAFAPVLGVDLFLDAYIRSGSDTRYQDSVNTLNNTSLNALNGALVAIKKVSNESPSLCTPTFIANVKKQLIANHMLAQMVVENSDRVQYCDGFGGETKYSVLSNELPISKNSGTISIVKIENIDEPFIKVSYAISNKKIISAFVHVSSDLSKILPSNIASAAYLSVRLSDGTNIISSGNLLDNKNIYTTVKDHSNITVTSNNNSHLIHSTLIIPFNTVRAGFAGLYTVLTIVALVLGLGVLMLVIYIFRNTNFNTFDLEKAITKGEFQPYYQPVVNLKTGQLLGCEVLVRWVKKDGTVLSPGFFIDLAESSGLAVPMTIKLMEQVREDLSELSKQQPELKIGINLFEGHFRNSIIVDDVKAIFSDSNVLFSQLVFEITERRPLTNQIAVDAVVGGLQALGCKLALDDAGTGYSNLAYMERLGVDIIKIDRVFVNMIGNGTSNVPILDGLISMAFDLDAEIIAEGIETEDQAVYLRARGVVQAQGFLFAPALKKDTYIELAQQMNKPAKPKLAKVEDNIKTSKKAA
ncbi:MAG: EAL domain-containing protein [Devosiaceae bacterium]|nr:EAL domain-containing protein [Devosiaceae bacterium]